MVLIDILIWTIQEKYWHYQIISVGFGFGHCLVRSLNLRSLVIFRGEFNKTPSISFERPKIHLADNIHVLILCIVSQIRSIDTILSLKSELKSLCLLMSQLNKLEKLKYTESLLS